VPLSPEQRERLDAVLAERGQELRRETVEVLEAPSIPTPRTGGRPRLGARLAPNRVTAREAEVLQLAADGLTNVQIAERLIISEETVKSHIRHVLDKLDAASRTHAVALGIRSGLIF